MASSCKEYDDIVTYIVRSAVPDTLRVITDFSGENTDFLAGISSEKRNLWIEVVRRMQRDEIIELYVITTSHDIEICLNPATDVEQYPERGDCAWIKAFFFGKGAQHTSRDYASRVIVYLESHDGLYVPPALRPDPIWPDASKSPLVLYNSTTPFPDPKTATNHEIKAWFADPTKSGLGAWPGVGILSLAAWKPLHVLLESITGLEMSGINKLVMPGCEAVLGNMDSSRPISKDQKNQIGAIAHPLILYEIDVDCWWMGIAGARHWLMVALQLYATVSASKWKSLKSAEVRRRNKMRSGVPARIVLKMRFSKKLVLGANVRMAEKDVCLWYGRLQRCILDGDQVGMALTEHILDTRDFMSKLAEARLALKNFVEESESYINV
ncbi:hypothetical protein WAI453_003604 [Rhynchosporium graminicola]|uniref:Uncharacterized protein n=1 Tax=Rhynchosporium graminicola TaxID=2792576 RepID=A0A1E1K464_9HELO|nr:uncharacterized protein RCO7_01576 [Rhynchosporium commune]